MRRSLEPALPALIAAATLITFLPALRGGFVNWDDHLGIVNNPAFRGFSLGHLRWMFTTGLLGHYQPLAWLSLALDHALWGMRPFGYHLSAVLLHALNAVLLYYVARLLQPSKAGAALAALLWALHPLRVESVAWVTERRDLLSSGFLLGATWAYVRHARGGREGRGMYAMSGLLFAGAMLSKVTSAAWPVAMFAVDLHLKRRAWAEKLPYLLLAAVLLPLSVKAQRDAGCLIGLDRIGVWQRALQASFATAFYPWKTLAPFGLAPWYDDAYLLARAWLAAAGVLLAGGVLWAARRRPSALAAAGLFYLLALFPMSGVVKSAWQVAADRYSYVPLMGAAILAGGWAGARLARGRREAFAALAALAVLWGALAWRQCGFWRDSETLWRRALAVNPGSGFAAVNAANALQEQGRFEEAVAGIRRALASTSGHPDGPVILAQAESNLGVELVNKDRPAEAIPHFQAALRIASRSSAIWLNLAVAQKETGDLASARKSLRNALTTDPANIDAAILLERWKKGDNTGVRR